MSSSVDGWPSGAAASRDGLRPSRLAGPRSTIRSSRFSFASPSPSGPSLRNRQPDRIVEVDGLRLTPKVEYAPKPVLRPRLPAVLHEVSGQRRGVVRLHAYAAVR